MELDLKFTGKFTKLKEMGYKLLKLYANNYKVYNKKLDKSFDIWIWVAHGGYIEINDLYSNTKNFIEAIKTINWEERTSFLGAINYRHMFVRINHSFPERGYLIVDKSLEMEVILSLPENVRKSTGEDFSVHYDKAYAKAHEQFDREVFITEKTCKELLLELEKINS